MHIDAWLQSEVGKRFPDATRILWTRNPETGLHTISIECEDRVLRFQASTLELALAHDLYSFLAAKLDALVADG